MRQVYFDPFGSYTAGHNLGVTTQMGLESGARAARDSDFNFNYMLPLQYRAAQRQDSLGEFGLPLQKNALQYADQMGLNNVYNSNQDIAASFARNYGVTAPYDATAFERFGIRPEVQQYVSPNGVPVPQVQYMMQGPNGEMVPVGSQVDPQQALLHQLNLPDIYKQLEMMNNMRWQQIQSAYGGRTGGGGAATAPSAANNFGMY